MNVIKWKHSQVSDHSKELLKYPCIIKDFELVISHLSTKKASGPYHILYYLTNVKRK